MRILFITPWYPDESIKFHGIFIREQAANIAAGHQVALVSVKVNYASFGLHKYQLTTSQYRGVSEFRLVINRSLPFYNTFHFLFVANRVLLQIAKEFKPDIIHGNIGFPGGILSFWLATKLKIPFVITEHTLIHNNFRSFFHKWTTLLSFRKASAMITVSTFAASLIRKYVDREVLVVLNTIDTNRFCIAPFQEGPIHIGFLGTLNSESHIKGLDLLLQAISKVQKDYVLHVVGEGKMIPHYQKLAEELGISNRCVWLGYVHDEDIPAFMNGLNFFVNCSRFESFGIAIIEAMASGVPVVVTNNGGPADTVTPLTGILLPDRDIDRLSGAITRMCDTFQNYHREEIRAHVIHHFSYPLFFQKMTGIYLDTLENFKQSS